MERLRDAKKHNANIEKMDQEEINKMIQQKINIIDGQPIDKGT